MPFQNRELTFSSISLSCTAVSIRASKNFSTSIYPEAAAVLRRASGMTRVLAILEGVSADTRVTRLTIAFAA